MTRLLAVASAVALLMGSVAVAQNSSMSDPSNNPSSVAVYDNEMSGSSEAASTDQVKQAQTALQEQGPL